MERERVERESDLLPIVEVLGGIRREGHAWPPEELAPGITLQRRRRIVRNPKTQEPTAVTSYLEPVVMDTQAYYAHLHARLERPEDAKRCPSCNGARYVRHGELSPGRPGFGMFAVCPRYVPGTAGVRGKCVQLDHMGLER